jgi:hypothetical protein
MRHPFGNQYRLLDAIIDHKSDGRAVKHADRYVIVNGRRHVRKTTAGWKHCVKFRDGTTSWERLADVKESTPWKWLSMLSHMALTTSRLCMVGTIHSQASRPHHCCCQQAVPEEDPQVWDRGAQDVETCLGVGQGEWEYKLWEEAIAKEMANVRVAFKILNDGEEPPPFHQFMKCHMVFEIKLDGFR